MQVGDEPGPFGAVEQVRRKARRQLVKQRVRQRSAQLLSAAGTHTPSVCTVLMLRIVCRLARTHAWDCVQVSKDWLSAIEQLEDEVLRATEAGARALREANAEHESQMAVLRCDCRSCSSPRITLADRLSARTADAMKGPL